MFPTVPPAPRVGDPALKPWAPPTLGAKAGGRDRGELTEKLQEVLSVFLSADLGIAGAWPGGAVEDDMLEVVCAVDGLSGPLTCRIVGSQARWLCAAMFGAGAPDVSTSAAGDAGPIVQDLSNRLVACFVDKFCEAASSVAGAQMTRSLDGAPTQRDTSRNGAAGSDERISLVVEPCRVEIEYVLSALDLDRIVSAARDDEPEGRSATGAESGKLATEVGRSIVRLTGMLDAPPATLTEIRSWASGAILQLDPAARTDAILMIEGEALFRCEVARCDGRFALRILENEQ